MNKIHKNAKRRLHKAAVCIITLLVISPNVVIVSRADDGTERTLDGSADKAIEEFFDIIPGGQDKPESLDDIADSVGVKRVLYDIIGAVRGESSRLVAFTLCLIGMSLLSALASLCDGELARFCSRAVSAVFSALLFERLVFLVKGAVSAIADINSFFAAVIPVVLTVNSLGASPTTAALQASGMGLTLSAYTLLAEHVLGAVVFAVFIGSALSALDPVMQKVSKSIKNVFLSVIGILSLLIGATFSLQSTISSSADSLAIRSAKYAVSGAVPIVGSAISGALGLLSGGVSYARTVIGAGSIAVILSIMLAPIATLLAYRTCVRLGIAFCSLSSLDGCENVLSASLGALDMVIALYSLTSAVYVAELAAFLKGGASLA